MYRTSSISILSACTEENTIQIDIIER